MVKKRKGNVEVVKKWQRPGEHGKETVDTDKETPVKETEKKW